MKVLWVCNIMLPAVAEYFGQKVNNKEGWLSGLCSVILERQRENQIDLHVAFPVDRLQDGYVGEVVADEGRFHCYGFYEDVKHAERYTPELETSLKRIVDLVQPDVIHCFGTEFAHTLAMLLCVPNRERVLVGMQGVCSAIAEAYMADLPKKVQKSVTFRDILKGDSLRRQQKKFALRGEREEKVLAYAQNVTGRTDFDRAYVKKCNPDAEYFSMNETLRPCFYGGKWYEAESIPHSVFVSQGDYPLKGLHYMFLAATKLKESYPDVQIFIAGNSLVEYRTLRDKIKISGYGKYLRSLIKRYQLEDCVHFTGKLTALEMREQYLVSSVYVCCSANENSPNSLGEAMLLGMPCVAADVGGISDLFIGGEDGILYRGYENPEKDINNACDCIADALCAAISKIWENPDETKEFCKNARTHARKTHDREVNYQKMMEIYAKIAAKQEGEN